MINKEEFARLSEEAKRLYLQKLRSDVLECSSSSTTAVVAKKRAPASVPDTTSQATAESLPFPLLDIQESFVTGRMLGRKSEQVGCHFYAELKADRLNVAKLEHCWNQLIQHHAMLRTVVKATGQQTRASALSYEFVVHDLRNSSAEEIDGHLTAVRQRMSHKVYALGSWPLFEIAISELVGNVSIVHFSIDSLVCDGRSVRLLLEQWFGLYTNEEIELPHPRISFRDYVLAVKEAEKTSTFQKSLSYWVAKLEGGVVSPQLPWAEPGADSGGHSLSKRKRLEGALNREKWRAIVEKANALKVSPTTILLTVFSEVLSSRSTNQEYGLVLTVYDPLRIDPLVDCLVGPLLSTNIFCVREHGGRSFEAVLRENQAQLWSDLDNGRVSGIRAFRELRATRKIASVPILPVVFTSMINMNASEKATAEREHRRRSRGWEVAYSVMQTPQVYLDHQAYEQDLGLGYSWDVAIGYFSDGVAEELFADYGRALEALCQGRLWTWDTIQQCTRGRRGVDDWGSDSRPRDAKGRIATGGVVLTEGEGRIGEEFPLTEQQQAYFVGRTSLVEGGSTSCQVYQEFDIKGLVKPKLEEAWQRVVESHEMLRAVIGRNGMQRTLKEVPQCTIAELDLSAESPATLAGKLTRVREEMTKRVSPLGEWPFFELKVTKLPKGVSRLHVSVDMLIADGKSIKHIYDQLFSLYARPERELPRPRVSFHDYVLALEGFKRSADYRKASAYWEKKFEAIPAGPRLPGEAMLASSGVTERKRFERKIERWSAIERQARRLSVSPSTVLLTVYHQVIAAWCTREPFTIVVVNWERMSLHPDIDDVIGDFTTLGWLSVSFGDEPFREKVKTIERLIEQDVQHSVVSGLGALRRAAVRNFREGVKAFPVVFTSSLEPNIDTQVDGITVGYGVSKTPQVYLDNFNSIRNGTLHYSWDAAIGVYSEDVLDKMFSACCRILEQLANDEESWNTSHFDALVAGAEQQPMHPGTPVEVESCGRVAADDGDHCRDTRQNVKTSSTGKKGGVVAHSSNQSQVALAVESIVGSVLGLNAIDEAEDLFELGATSDDVARITGRIEDTFAVTVPVDVFLEDASTKSIVEYIIEARSTEGIPERLASAIGEEARSIASEHFLPTRECEGRRSCLAGDGEGLTTRSQPSVGDEVTRRGNGDGVRAAAQKVSGLFESLLRCDRVPEHTDIFDLGATSYTVVQLIQMIEDSVGVVVPLEVVMTTPTKGEITKYVYEALEARAHQSAVAVPTETDEVGRNIAAVANAQSDGLNGAASNVRTILGGLLKRDGFDGDEDIFDLGATSYTVVQLMQMIEDAVGVVVPLEVLLANPSANGISEYVANALKMAGSGDGTTRTSAFAAANREHIQTGSRRSVEPKALEEADERTGTTTHLTGQTLSGSTKEPHRPATYEGESTGPFGDVPPSVLGGLITDKLSGHDRALGLKVLWATRDRIEAELEIDERHRDVYGGVHGGVHSAIVETLGSVGAFLAQDSDGCAIMGLENHTSFLRVVTGGTLRATAVPVATSGKSQLWEVRIATKDGKLAASGRLRSLRLDVKMNLPMSEGVSNKGEAPRALQLARADIIRSVPLSEHMQGHHEPRSPS